MKIRWTDDRNPKDKVIRYEVLYDEKNNLILPLTVEECRLKDQEFCVQLGEPRVEAGTSYTIRVRCISKSGPGEWSEATVFTYFPGILFSERAKKAELISSAKYTNLKDVGITLSIPEDAFYPRALQFEIQPCFSGSWEVPENLELVSPAYIVKPSRDIVFRKKILVKIWHHVKLESEKDCEKLTFLSARTVPKYRDGNPVYTFRKIRTAKGLFRPGEPTGEIELIHFCILGIGIFRPIVDYLMPQGTSSMSSHKANGKLHVFCFCNKKITVEKT
jgi:hypothetical protein